MKKITLIEWVVIGAFAGAAVYFAVVSSYILGTGVFAGRNFSSRTDWVISALVGAVAGAGIGKSKVK